MRWYRDTLLRSGFRVINNEDRRKLECHGCKGRFLDKTDTIRYHKTHCSFRTDEVYTEDSEEKVINQRPPDDISVEENDTSSNELCWSWAPSWWTKRGLEM